MYCKFCLPIAGIAALVASITIAQPSKDTAKPKSPVAQPTDQKPPLPKGWTEADMQACMDAGTPGEMHKLMAEGVGTWAAKSTMWMTPDSEPSTSDCTVKVSTMMDGRFTKCEMSGEMAGMGPFSGFGLQGYDNVSKKFQGTWVDSMGTGMMMGTGDISSDGKTMNWTYTFNCPVAKKQATMRQVERITGKDTRTMQMFGPDPKTGKEYKIMEMTMTRTSGGPAVTSGH